ncbi:hypothetical protein FRC00_006667 [Tulasnella sp. 408]|nr:hypothetical protein FRC00_006667 [Tulasnella sp. 408]
MPGFAQPQVVPLGSQEPTPPALRSALRNPQAQVGLARSETINRVNTAGLEEGDSTRVRSGVFTNLLKLYGMSGNGLHHRRTGRSQSQLSMATDASRGRDDSYDSMYFPTARNYGGDQIASRCTSTMSVGNMELLDPDDPRVTGARVNTIDQEKHAKDTVEPEANLDKRRKRQASIKYHISSVLARQTFILRLAKALMLFGSPSHRLESQLKATAVVLDVQAEFVHMPNIVVVSFGDFDTKTSQTHFIKVSGVLQLGRLHTVHKIYRNVVHDDVGVEEATAQLNQIIRAKPIFGTVMASEGMNQVVINGRFAASNDSAIRNFAGSFTFTNGTSLSSPPNTIDGCYRDPNWPWYLQPFPIWSLVILVPAFSIFSSASNGQPLRSRQLPVMTVISCASFAANTAANHLIFNRSDVVSAIGAFVAGLLGNLYSRVAGIAATGGLSQNYRGLDGDQYSNGLIIGLRTVQVAIGITCIISPHLGHLSDKYGRKPVLLATMIGNVLSAVVWIQSTSFASFLLSRAIGGLSEGNVQLSIAIISDVTSQETRSRGLSLVGIAFAICFCIGPPIGAWFSTHPLPISAFHNLDLNIYATPALLSLVLLLVEIVLLVVALPETRQVATASAEGKQATSQDSSGAAKASATERLSALRRLGRIHLLFLALFSVFDWNNAQNGRLLMTIGIVSALLQGGYVRRAKFAEAALARRGVFTCAVATGILATLPALAGGNSSKGKATSLLYVAAVFLAFTSATVVNALNAMASMQCDDAGVAAVHPDLAKGKALGRHRSAGQLGRAIGPLLACAAYWTVGPTITYGAGAIAMAALFASMRMDRGLSKGPQKKTD